MIDMAAIYYGIYTLDTNDENDGVQSLFYSTTKVLTIFRTSQENCKLWNEPKKNY